MLTVPSLPPVYLSMTVNPCGGTCLRTSDPAGRPATWVGVRSCPCCSAHYAASTSIASAAGSSAAPASISPPSASPPGDSSGSTSRTRRRPSSGTRRAGARVEHVRDVVLVLAVDLVVCKEVDLVAADRAAEVVIGLGDDAGAPAKPLPLVEDRGCDAPRAPWRPRSGASTR